MPDFSTLVLPEDGTCAWAGCKDYRLVTADGKHMIDVPYEWEPPHGDSIHTMVLNGKKLPGFVWGCGFAASPDSIYLAASYMRSDIERKTIIINLETHKYLLTPFYLHWFRFEGMRLVEQEHHASHLSDTGRDYIIPVDSDAWTGF